jgi:hypothetical protein
MRFQCGCVNPCNSIVFIVWGSKGLKAFATEWYMLAQWVGRDGT